MVPTMYNTQAVDTEEDLKKVANLMKISHDAKSH